MKSRTYIRKGCRCTVRLAETTDAKRLESVRLRIDGETELIGRLNGI